MLWLVRTTPGAYDTRRGLQAPAGGRLWVYGAPMLRPRARVGRTAAVVPLIGLLALTGCGSSTDESRTDAPSKAALACRATWKELGAQTSGRDSRTNPSALAPRWNNIAATVDYYATSASAGDCGTRLDEQKASMQALASFTTRLAPYDMELRLEQVQSDAQRYASGPQPAAPEESGPAKKRDRPKPASRTAGPAEVGLALKTLQQQAPVATRQQGPGWQQARVADLADTAAVTKTVKDLAFLSGESPAYRACSAALILIGRALATTRK
jgi:hypothetical protein